MESQASPYIVVVGFTQHNDISAAAPSHHSSRSLPASPLAQALRQESLAMPRLRINTRLSSGIAASSSTASAVASCTRYMDTASPSAASCACSTGSVPIPIPECCRVSHSLESQIMEDLSLDAVAHCMPRASDLARSMGGSVAASLIRSFTESEACWPMDHDVETATVAQLRGLEASAKQAEEGSPIVHVVESMRFAAEDHDRLLAECALLKARSSCDACIFDLDLDMTETCQGRSAYSVPRWVAA